jgi:hypothetical protein
MMVWGCVASSEDLAGATSGLKAVPLTTTVSTAVDGTTLEVAAATCCAWALPAKLAPANRATTAVERHNNLADIINNSSNSKHVEDKRTRSRDRILLRLHALGGPNLAVPVSDAQIARVNDSSVTPGIRILNQAAASRPLGEKCRETRH